MRQQGEIAVDAAGDSLFSGHVTLYTALSHQSLLDAAGPFIERYGQTTGLLIVTANRLAADDLVYSYCGETLRGVYRFTMEQLVHELCRKQLLEKGLIDATPMVLHAMAARVAYEATVNDELTYFRSVARTPGFSSALLRTLTELGLQGVSDEALRKGGFAGVDLAILMGKFRGELEENRFVDYSVRIKKATTVVSGGQHSLCGLPLLLLFPVIEYSTEKVLISSLVRSSSQVLAVSLEHESTNLRTLLQVDPIPITCNVDSCLKRAQQKLFSIERGTQHEGDASFEMFSASGEALECVEIVRRILSFVEQGVVFDRIAIVLRNPSAYQAVLEEAFSRSNIPVWFAHGSQRPRTAGRALLSLLECAREGFAASRFLEYLSLGQVPLRLKDSKSNDRQAFSLSYWEALINEAAVIGGKDRWQERLQGLKHTLQLKHDEAEEETTRTGISKHLSTLDALIAFALPLIGMLELLPANTTWRDWLDRLRALVDFAVEDSSSFDEMFDELEPLNDIGGVTIQDVILLIGDRLRSLQVKPQERRYGRVFVGTVEDVRGTAFEVVFVPGLAEGIFPRPATEDPLLLNETRQRVSGDLRVVRDEDERILLRTTLAAAKTSFVCSYSRMDLLTGRARVPSLYFFELTRAALGDFVEIRNMEVTASQGTETRAGWPAPKNEMDAIDDAEFDLAMIGHKHGKGENGPGAYLAHVNPLAQSLVVRRLRWNNPAWNSGDGLVDIGVEAQSFLDNHSLRKRVYSVSLLQDFAICPYRFALRAIYGLRPIERATSPHRMNAQIRGKLYHRVTFEVMRELMIVPFSEGAVDQGLAAVDRILLRIANEFKAKYSPAISSVWEGEVISLRADLRGWLQLLVAQSKYWRPIAAELAFGLKANSDHDLRSSSRSIQILDKVKLRGSIDLVEERTDNKIRVTDYKTGRVRYPQPKIVGGGATLQPLVYALVAEQLVNKTAVAGRLYHGTIKGGYKSISLPLNNQSRQKLIKVLDTIDSWITKGFLPAAPNCNACKTCDYLQICGPYEEERANRKSSTELSALNDIRNIK